MNCDYCTDEYFNKASWIYNKGFKHIYFEDDNEDEFALFEIVDGNIHEVSHFYPRKPQKLLNCCNCRTFIDKLIHERG